MQCHVNDVMLVGSGGCVVNNVFSIMGYQKKYILGGALVYGLGAYEPTCTPW